MKSKFVKFSIDEETGEVVETVEVTETPSVTSTTSGEYEEEPTDIIVDDETTSQSTSTSVDGQPSVSVSSSAEEGTEIRVDGQKVSVVTSDENEPEVIDVEEPSKTVVVTPDTTEEFMAGEVIVSSEENDGDYMPKMMDETTKEPLPENDPTPKADPDDREDTPAENVPAATPVVDAPVVSDSKVDEIYDPKPEEIVEDGAAIDENVKQVEIVSDTIEELKYCRDSIKKYGLSPQAMMLMNRNNILSDHIGIALPAHERLSSVGRNDVEAQMVYAALEAAEAQEQNRFVKMLKDLWEKIQDMINKVLTWIREKWTAFKTGISKVKNTAWEKISPKLNSIAMSYYGTNELREQFEIWKQLQVEAEHAANISAADDEACQAAAEKINELMNRAKVLEDKLQEKSTTFGRIKASIRTIIQQIETYFKEMESFSVRFNRLKNNMKNSKFFKSKPDTNADAGEVRSMSASARALATAIASAFSALGSWIRGVFSKALAFISDLIRIKKRNESANPEDAAAASA